MIFSQLLTHLDMSDPAPTRVMYVIFKSTYAPILCLRAQTGRGTIHRIYHPDNTFVGTWERYGAHHFACGSMGVMPVRTGAWHRDGSYDTSAFYDSFM